MKKFDILYESIMLSYDNPYYNYEEDEYKKEFRSYLEFQHFCKNLNLITKLITPIKDGKFQFCIFYFMNEFDSDNHKVQFDYLNTYEYKYVEKYKDLYDKLNDYKEKYIVTLDGKNNSTRIRF